ncbi:MAG: hypothetical protein IKQ93_06715 [Candidatus Methanomethylophilaceae archaeon]|nr:hypothetical protein [Candidatus Methanomethylophilaceae archaeon]
MFEKSISGKKSNDFQNGFQNDLRILRGEADVERLCLQDIIEIVEYGWDRNDLQRMLDSQDYRGIGCLAAWIRECGNSAHGMMVEDDPYFYPLDEDGNYVEGAFGRCC